MGTRDLAVLPWIADTGKLARTSYVNDAVQALELLARPAGSMGVARLDGDNVLEAHNGYIAIYLDLGLIGLCLLCTFLITTYRKICKRLKPFTLRGSLGLGLWSCLGLLQCNRGRLRSRFSLRQLPARGHSDVRVVGARSATGN